MEEFSTPILFLVFNRPETTAVVFEEIKRIKPKYLFVACDGPREGVSGESETVESVKKLITENINWECEVKTLFRDKNLGCKIAVSSALDWFFGQVEEGIILEDDCLPDQSFFYYCQALLEKFRYDDRVMHIGGNNFQDGIKRGNDSYYFSIFNHIWGWATWRRAWKYYDLTMRDYPEFEKQKKIFTIFNKLGEQIYWQKIFKNMFAGKINTWDYAWFFSCLLHGGLSCTPNVNLVSNIGLNNSATHFSLRDDLCLSRQSISFPLTHPVNFVANREADSYTDKRFFKTGLLRVVSVSIIDYLGIKNSLKKIILKFK
jgi:hypothetical protein